MKKTTVRAFGAGLLAAALLACPVSAVSFPDVDSNADYAAAVAYVSEAGVMVGDSQGNFNPNKIVSRAEMATVVCRVLNQADNLSASEVFTDVPASHWANPYIGKAAELGAVSGYGGGKFGPSDPVTYEQAVTMIISAIGEGDKAASYGGYPKGHLQAAQEDGLLTGIQAVQGQGLSRGAVAVLLYNCYITQNNSGTSSNVGEHIHNYIEKMMTIRQEEVVQVGTRTVNDYAQVTIYGCNACSFTTHDSDEMIRHVDARYAPITSKCWCSTWWWKTTTEVVGTHEEPDYHTRVVESISTVRACSICGAIQ